MKGFGYFAQESWIQHLTLRENILFGKTFDREWYDSVLDACALRSDLKVFSAPCTLSIRIAHLKLQFFNFVLPAFACGWPNGDWRERSDVEWRSESSSGARSGSLSGQIHLVRFLKDQTNNSTLLQNKSVYLLDDPLAAVDAHVAKHLFDQCVLGLLAKKTRILCTHHVKFLRRADFVVVLQDGKVVKQGGNNND